MRGGGQDRPAIDGEALLTLSEVERRHVLAVLESVDGNRARAAELLDISERNLYRLLKRYAERTGQAP